MVFSRLFLFCLETGPHDICSSLGTNSVDQAGLALRALPASASLSALCDPVFHHRLPCSSDISFRSKAWANVLSTQITSAPEGTQNGHRPNFQGQPVRLVRRGGLVSRIFHQQKPGGEFTLPAANKWQPLTASNMLGEMSGWAGRCDCARDCFTFFTSTRHRARSSPERKEQRWSGAPSMKTQRTTGLPMTENHRSLCGQTRGCSLSKTRGAEGIPSLEYLCIK